MFNEILDHEDRAKAALVSQYQDKPVLADVIGAHASEVQAAETMLVQLNVERSVDSATGAILDRLGAIVGLTREPGQSDADYRLLIKSQIGKNVSQGEPERLIEVFRTLVSAGLVHLGELFPAEVQLSADVSLGTEANRNMLFQVMDKVAPAGVRIGYLCEFDPVEPFAFDGGSGLGFGDDLDPLVGGKLGDCFEDTNALFAFDGGGSPTDEGFGDNTDVLAGGAFDPAA